MEVFREKEIWEQKLGIEKCNKNKCAKKLYIGKPTFVRLWFQNYRGQFFKNDTVWFLEEKGLSRGWSTVHRCLVTLV